MSREMDSRDLMPADATALDRHSEMTAILFGLSSRLYSTEQLKNQAYRQLTALATNILRAPSNQVEEVSRRIDSASQISMLYGDLEIPLREEFPRAALTLVTARGKRGLDVATSVLEKIKPGLVERVVARRGP